jgi:hypothetical protein
MIPERKKILKKKKKKGSLLKELRSQPEGNLITKTRNI